MKKLIALTAIAVAGNGAVFAQQEPLSPAATSEQVVANAAPANADDQVSAQTFQDWVDEFEAKFKPIGDASNGVAFFSGQAPVRVSAMDPNFGQELALAYEKAMFDMRADFIMQTYGRMVSKSIREVYENGSSNKDEFDPVELEKAAEQGGDRLDVLLDKALNLADKALDNALIEQGVPAEDVQKMSVEQRKTNYKNNYRKEMVKTAFRSMQGLVPVQTRIFTNETSNGPVVIVGVIAVQSEKTRQFAMDISRKRPSSVQGEPKKLNDVLPDEKSKYLNEIGLRFSYDEAGRPMLISYGRYALSVAPDWKPARVYQSTQNATAIARTLAESGIVEFMNTSVQVTERTLTGSQEEDLVAKITHFESGKKTGEELQQTAIGETLSSLLKEGRSTASGDLRGTTVVKRWDLKDAANDKVIHVGAVVTWTYDQLNNANAIDAQGRGQSAQKPAAAAGAAGVPERASKTINKMSDF